MRTADAPSTETVNERPVGAVSPESSEPESSDEESSEAESSDEESSAAAVPAQASCVLVTSPEPTSHTRLPQLA